MIYLFVDNYRGFKETLLPIEDTNFLVGENSTGKTSILALIKILESTNFWIGHRFETEEIELLNFNDIVSEFAKDRSYFRVGAMEIKEDEKKDQDKCKGFLASFVKREGMPRISRYTCILDNKRIDTRFIGRNVLYKIEELEHIVKDAEQINKTFLNWVRIHKENGRGYKTLKVPSPIGTTMGGLNAIFRRIIREERMEEKGVFTIGMPDIFGNIRWLAPIRTKPQRIYDRYDYKYSPEGHHTPYLIKRFIGKKKTAEEFLEFIKDFGKESGLFDTISIQRYGSSSTAPFELDIVLYSRPINIINVGYGVSQILPVIVEIFTTIGGTRFVMQQPEVHLHPRAQAALGDLFFKLGILEKKKFIVETHSEFIIDRFRTNYRKEKEGRKPRSQIIYFESSLEGNTAYTIPILENGELPSEQPSGYRDFFLKEDLSVLGY